MKNKTVRILLAVAFLFLLTPLTVFAQEKIPGVAEGTGTHFEINDSQYLNISLDSDREISLKIKSIPKIISIKTEESKNNSTNIAIAGLIPGFVYHKYQDNYHNHEELSADETGRISFTQDTVQSHIIFIQPKKSTKFIQDNETGGDCQSIGNWDNSEKTCRLNQDVFETIEIDNDNLTLDGNNHKIEGKETGSGIYVIGKNTTIKNITISNFDYGIFLFESENNKLEDLTVQSNIGAGIILDQSQKNTISNITSKENAYIGMDIFQSDNNILKNNIIQDNEYGIFNESSNNNTYQNNRISDNTSEGITISRSTYSILQNNEIQSNGDYGLTIFGSDNNTLSENSISDNSQINQDQDGYNFSIEDQNMSSNSIDKTNTIEGKPIYYEQNIQNKTYDNEEIGAFYCVNCQNITLKNISFPEHASQIFFQNTINSIIENTTSPDKSHLLSLVDSDNNIIKNNDFYLIYRIQNSNHNKIYQNNIWSIYDPVFLYSEDTTLFNLDLPEGGNYWKQNESSCQDDNSDQFCDFPFKIYKKIYDNYPRVNPVEIVVKQEPKEQKEGNSNILFIPGIQASRLYKKQDGQEDQLWEPYERNEDVEKLYLDETGESINEGIYTKDAIDEVFGVGENVYKGFFAFLEQLQEEKTINDWEPLPYDWRYSPERVIRDGVVMADGSIVDPVAKLESLATSAENGKVTIISHSNGGVFAKLLVNKLKEKGKQDLVDKIIFVATPQMGTPKTLASLLHGDEINLGYSTILNKKTARGFSENMASAYNLLPTKKYFETVKTPVIEFSDEVKDIYDFRSYYGESVNSFDEMKQFLLGESGKRADPSFSDTDSPNILSEFLLEKTETLHDEIDNWQAPEGTKVIQIAGWGLDTIAGIEYDNCDMVFCDGLENLDRKLKIVQDGDETVVTASATMINDIDYYVDIESYNEELIADLRKNRDHASILEIDSLQYFIKNLILGDYSITKHIYEEKPEVKDDDKRLRLQMHSPVDVHLYDNEGRHTGLIENPNPNSDLKMYEEEIPNSYYWEFGETKYLGVGTEETTKIDLEGTGTGSFTFEIDEVSGTNETVSETAFKDIPVFEGMKADLSIENGTVTAMNVDLEGDGKSDFSITLGDNEEKEEASILILDKILSNLTCHKSVKQPLTQRMIQVKKLYSQNKINPANNILEAMISHLEAVKKRSDLSKLGISSEEIENLIGIIEGVKLNN